VSDLWFEASADHDYEARQASLATAEAEMTPVYSFLFQAASARELEHRLAYAAMRLEHIAASCGLAPGDLEDTARRRYALLREALTEGMDPVAPVLQGGQGGPGGAEKPAEHDEGPDFSHGYSEVPQGPPGGPDPRVTQVAGPALQQQPLPGATASLCRCGSRLTRKSGKCRACRERPGACLCRTALTSGGTPVTGMPQTGAGGPMMPAGAGGGTATPDGTVAGGALPGAQTAAGGMAPQPGQAGNGYDLTPAQPVTAGRDPVARQVAAVAASVAASNPQLPAAECRRVARKVVGSFLHQADLAGSVMRDEPVSAPGPGSESGTDTGSGGLSGMGEYGLGKALISKLPGAGGAAAGLGELAGVAELAAL
jgi:hypothetical protein